MPSIQQSLNQALSSFGIMSRLSPDYEKRIETKRLKEEEKVLGEQLEKAQEAAVKYDMEQNPNMENAELSARQLGNIGSIYGAQYENLKKQFELSPTSAGYERMASAQTQQAEMAKLQKSLNKRAANIKNQKSGLSERKEILKKPEASTQETILQMKKASEKNKNREKALSSVLPKGGM